MAKRLSVKALLKFTTALSQLLNSRLSLQDALSLLVKITADRETRTFTAAIHRELHKGSSFAATLQNGGYGLPPLYTGLMEIGERIGSIGAILPTLESYLSRNKRIRDKLINAAIYPSIVLLMTVTGAVFIVAFVLPRLQNIFFELGASPDVLDTLNTNIQTVTTVAILITLLFTALLVIFLGGMRWAGWRKTGDILLLSTPGIRRILLSIEMFNLCYAVETLTAHGVTLSAALEEAQTVCSNTIMQQVFADFTRDVNSGQSLHSAAQARKRIPLIVKEWLAIGEQTGQSTEVFRHLREFYEHELDNTADRFVGWIEPVLIIAVGVIIIAMVFTFIVPLFAMFGSIL